MSNGITGNSVAALRRNFFGGLETASVVATGGTGVGVGTTAPPPDPLGSQNSLLLSRDGQWLFAVNAGSNDITVFDVRHGAPRAVGVFPSGGTYPVSLAERSGSLYVLNSAGTANVSVFRIARNGYLSAVRDGTRGIGSQVPLVGNQPDVGNTAAQLQFDRTGRWLVVTQKSGAGVGAIETYAVSADGTLSKAPTVTRSADPAPFGFTFDGENHLLVAEAGRAAMSSYAVRRDGSLALLDGSVTNGQAATCWVDAQLQYAFAANAGTSTITGYRIGMDGHLRLTQPDGVAASLGAGRAPTDIKLSDDGFVLFVNEPGTGDVGSFFVAPDGRLVALGTTHVFAPLSGMQGLAVQ
jgi:6-phosphogluconolactonase (cycloisomerase 2 family)